MTLPGEAKKYIHVRIEGRVQGVGFRAWTEMEAKALELAGWVRNRHDGSVEAVFQGEEDAVKTMLDLCRTGPPGARVDRLEVIAEGSGALKGFSVLPTA
ncbi:MAG TPA: acylphosphatase [Hyphomicrobiaceae bacterium]|nr:acylphosphatase [Hyphomicrobiaceae bacterium]